MKLKKALAVALTATMAFGTLTGCNKSGNDNNETTTTPAASQNETTTTEAASNGESSADAGIEACTIEFWHAMSNKQEEALTALFLGTTTTTNVIKSVEYRPGKDVANEVIARISNLNGIVDKTDLSGAPLYLSLRVVERATLPVNEKGETKKLPKDAVVYNIPGKAQVVIKFRGNTMFDDKFEMSQYGVTFGADPALFSDKKAPCYLIYRPETGSVLELRSLTE